MFRSLARIAAFALLLPLTWAQAQVINGPPGGGGGGGSPSGSSGDLQTFATSTTFGHVTPATGVAAFLAAPSVTNFVAMLTGAPLTPAVIGGSAANHAVPVDVAGANTYKVIPDCTDAGGNHINYTQSTDAFSCGTSGAAASPTFTTQSGTTYTLASGDCANGVQFTSASAVTVTIPATLALGCSIALVQADAGQVTVTGTAVAAATLHSFDAFTKTAGQWAAIETGGNGAGGLIKLTWNLP